MSGPPPDDRPSVRVISEVAEREGIDSVDIDTPLYEVIDPDALDSLFASAGQHTHGCHVIFTYAGHEVTVRADGTVDVTGPTERSRDAEQSDRGRT